MVHAAPSVSTFIVLMTTDVQFIPQHWKGYIPIAIAYSSVNFAKTKITGTPVYIFADWLDYKTPLLLSSVTVIFILFYFQLAKCSIWLN